MLRECKVRFDLGQTTILYLFKHVMQHFCRSLNIVGTYATRYE